MKNDKEKSKQLPELTNANQVAFYESIYEKSNNIVRKKIWLQLRAMALKLDISEDVIKAMKNFMPIFLIFIFSSCATVTQINKPLDECQKNNYGQKRELKSGAFILDVLFCPPGLAVDFLTKKIYRQCETKK